MKRFLTTTALVFATAGAAFAQDMNDAQQLRNAVGNYFETATMDVDVMTMTDEQVSEVYLAITSNDSASERDAAVRAVLNDWNVVHDNAEGIEPAGIAVTTPSDQLRTQVSTYFDQEGVAVDANTLSDAELAEVHLAINSGSESGRAAAVNDILANRMSGDANRMPNRDQLQIAVGNALHGTAYDGREGSLTDAELAEVYLTLNSSMSASEKDAQLESVFN